MEHAAEKNRVPTEHQVPDGTWLQITFTLDPEHYQMLWERAETEHRTLACLIREIVTTFLQRKSRANVPTKIDITPNAEDLP